MTAVEKAYFCAADVVARALRAAEENPEIFSTSFKGLSEEERKESQTALAHLCRLGIDSAITETKKHIS